MLGGHACKLWLQTVHCQALQNDFAGRACEAELLVGQAHIHNSTDDKVACP